jgi:two-component system, NtrC family, sensor histidine kinase PilS
LTRTFDGQPAAFEQARLLQWLVLLRVVISFIILYTTYVLYSPQSMVLRYSVSLVGGNVLVTLLAAVFIERRSKSTSFVLFQLYWDFAFVSALVYVTGGFDSLFNFLYILTIIFTAILTSQAHTMGVALACSAMYAAILIAQRVGLANPISEHLLTVTPPIDGEISVKISLNALAFISMGVLASYLSTRGREANMQMERQREEMEALKILNESIMQSLPICLLTTDEQDQITFTNANVEPIFGQTGSMLHGLHILDLLPDLAEHEFDMGPFNTELAIPKRPVQTLSITTAALRNAEDNITGRVITIQDITELRQLELVAQQADRQSAIAKLAAGIAHEIRNPLASMSGSIQLLSSELDLEPVHAHLMKIVLRETDRLNDLISDFLVYARPAKRRDTVANLAAAIEEQMGVLRNDPACENVVFEIDLESDLICQFDPGQIRQLFWNLFRNAVQAMEGGGVLTVAARKNPELHPGYILVEVGDTGEGISQENLETIFDPFFTTKSRGTGLGLTIANRIVENHGGRIIVNNNAGRGTVFQVLIPGLEMVSFPAQEPQ